MEEKEERERRDYPESKFSFKSDGKNPEEISKEIEELIKQRNALFESQGYVLNEQGIYVKPDKADNLRHGR